MSDSNIKIGLFGKARSGKDTVAEYLSNNYAIMPFAFGDELKKQFHNEYTHISEYPKPSRGYQLFGQLKRYTEGEDIWINHCFNKIDKAQQLGRDYHSALGTNLSPFQFNVMITDIRQSDELSRCKDEGFKIIKVVSSDKKRFERMMGKDKVTDFDEFNRFETETELDNFDYDFEIVNDGTIEELYEQINVIMTNF